MALRQPETLRVFIYDEQIPIPIQAPEQHDRVMRPSVIHRREPLDSPRVIERWHHMHFTPQRREELPGSNVPIPIQPGPLLPAAQSLEDSPILRVVEGIVPDSSPNESRLSFLSLLERKNKLRPIPAVPNPSGIGRGINPWPPVRLACSRAGRDVLMLPLRQSCRFFNSDHVVFQAELVVYVLFRLVVPRLDLRAIPELEQPLVCREFPP